MPKKIAEPAIAGCTPERISAGINRAPTAAAQPAAIALERGKRFKRPARRLQRLQRPSAPQSIHDKGHIASPVLDGNKHSIADARRGCKRRPGAQPVKKKAALRDLFYSLRRAAKHAFGVMGLWGYS